MIYAEANAGLTASFLKLGAEIPVRSDVAGIPIRGKLGFVHTETVVMLGNKIHIFCAAVTHQFSPFVCVEKLRAE